MEEIFEKRADAALHTYLNKNIHDNNDVDAQPPKRHKNEGYVIGLAPADAEHYKKPDDYKKDNEWQGYSEKRPDYDEKWQGYEEDWQGYDEKWKEGYTEKWESVEEKRQGPRRGERGGRHVQLAKGHALQLAKGELNMEDIESDESMKAYYIWSRVAHASTYRQVQKAHSAW